MDLYYAAGGGLGHIVRAERVLRTLGVQATIITTSPYADRWPVTTFPILRVPAHFADPHSVGAVFNCASPGAETGSYELAEASRLVTSPENPAATGAEDPTLVATPENPQMKSAGTGECAGTGEQVIDRHALVAWLGGVLETVRPSRVFVDTFPAGLFGELTELAALRACELTYVGRLLRWDSYRPHIGGTHLVFERALLLETLTPEHETFIRETSRTVEELIIEDDEERTDSGQEKIWLISHSGPAGEVRELLDYALEMRRIEDSDAPLVVATLEPPADVPAGVTMISLSSTRSLFASAERIFTGAGFNSMWELRKYRHKHRFIAFPRRYDDQFLRARRVREKR